MSLFTAEHDTLRDSVRGWVDAEIRPHAAAWDDAAAVPASLLQRAGALGYLGVGQPEEVGGTGGDVADAVVVAEELGRGGALGLALALLHRFHGAAPLLTAAGVPEAARAVFAGERGACLVIEGTGGDPAPAVLGRAWSDLAVVAGDDRVAVVAGEDGAAPPAGALGWRTGGVAGQGTVTEPLAVITGPPARAAAAGAIARVRLLEAAAVTAAAWGAWEATREYASQREAFGRPIARFQVNRHALADLASRLTAARELVYDAALGLASAATARLYAGDVALAAAERCLQLHGGFGYTMEFPIQRDWRDLHMLRSLSDRTALRNAIAGLAPEPAVPAGSAT